MINSSYGLHFPQTSQPVLPVENWMKTITILACDKSWSCARWCFVRPTRKEEKCFNPNYLNLTSRKLVLIIRNDLSSKSLAECCSWANADDEMLPLTQMFMCLHQQRSFITPLEGIHFLFTLITFYLNSKIVPWWMGETHPHNWKKAPPPHCCNKENASISLE